MKRKWLMGAVAMLAVGAAVSCGDDSGGTPGEDEGETRRRVAEALTAGIEFEGGRVELEPMPDTTDEDLVIEQDDAPIELTPGTAELLPFDIENDDADDPVVATLLQFEDAEDDQHVEVPIEEGATMDEVMLDVASDVCDNFCADSFAVKLIQALKTKGGRIGQRITRNLLLTCAEDGKDATMCESADPGDGDGDGDGDTTGDGDGDTELGATANSIASASIQVNNALCQCAGNTNCAQHRWITQAEIDCIDAAIKEDSANDTANLKALASKLRAAVGSIGSIPMCDPAQVFALAVPVADEQALPDPILECDTDMDTLYAPSTDAGVAPAP